MQKAVKVYCEKGKNMVYYIRQYRYVNKNIVYETDIMIKPSISYSRHRWHLRFCARKSIESARRLILYFSVAVYMSRWKRGVLKWKASIEKPNIRRNLFLAEYMALAAILFCGMVRFLTPWIWKNKCFSAPYLSAVLMAFRRICIAVAYMMCPGKQI